MIDWLGITIGLIVFFFILFLVAKKIVPGIACVLCIAVSATWSTLIVMAFVYHQPVRILIALLLAQSSVGVMYAVQKRIPRALLLFRLAYICSAIVFVGVVAGVPIGDVAPKILVILWVASTILFLFRENRMFHSLVQKIIACCKDW